ncbi:hypothetical protein [Mycoplasmopsis edwardii]|uniref:Uncharacterized protein n=1 Tax=Mycoplasmopsis edwardii TaxID=53558 RepID=A0ACD4PI31_9BACT|nr:hypothetical protein [Mycoplasmopsis edwardii]WBP84337.1 hypothetical protein Me_995_000317 [Mycoplasmopsis edwardii]
MYEFVPKHEYKPIRNEIENILKEVQKLLKKTNLSFQFKLVGSGNRHLITRIKNGNEGYDFDYNLIISSRWGWKASIREDFFNAIQIAIKGTRFNKIENSTSTITIKDVSNFERKVIVGCDFSIIFYPEDNKPQYYLYSRFNKNRNIYIWAMRNVSKFNDRKLNELKYYCGSDIWWVIRDEYLKLKENDKQKKHSFVLYHEAINNVYNYIFG